MKFGIVGNNDGPLYLLEALEKSSDQPAFIGLQKPARHELEKAYQHKLTQAHYFENFDESALVEKLKNYKLDLLINCFCNFKFSKILHLSFPVLNVHLSPLPAYRGRHPLQWALINGKNEFGISIHKMTERYDAGTIYWQKMVPVEEGMSVQELRSRLLDELNSGFAEFLQNFKKGNITPISNDDETASYVPRRYPDDSKLTEWDESEKIFRKVMALRSEDYSAFIIVENHKIKCLKASLGEQLKKPVKQPFIYKIQENKFQIACLDNRTIWLTCSPENKKYLSIGSEIEMKSTI